MIKAVAAIYENGVFKPEEPVGLKEKTKVHLVIETPAPEPVQDDDDPTGWKAANELIGFIKDAPEGEPIAEKHDDYLYE